MNYFIALLALAIVILVHEWGHYAAARKVGVRVYEFAVGFGPVVWRKTKDGTDYVLRLLPLGGFVKLGGMADDRESCPPAENYYHKSIPARLLVLAAGAGMNIITGFLLFFIILVTVGGPSHIPMVDRVVDGSPAQEAGLQKGDHILAVDGDVIEDLHEDLISLIQVSEGKQLLLQISREDQVQILAVTPREEEGSVRIGISFDFVYERYPFFEAIGQAGRNTYISGKQVFTSLAMLFSREASFQDLAGPIGLLQMGSAQLTQSFAQFLGLMALISVSLGVINLLPFPVLDGGHILFALIEGVTGRPLNRKVETGLYYVGAALLLTVMVLVIFNDVIHWGARQDILGGP